MTGRDYDVIVVGAGMIGAAFAAALSGSRLSVALLDAGSGPEPLPADRYDLRVSAVSPGTESILRAVGAWERMQAERIGPYRSMFVWDAGSSGSIEFEAAELGEPWLGYIIENANVHNALIQAVQSAPGIQCLFDAMPESLVSDDGGCKLVLADGRALSAKLVVGADGARSWVRDALDIPLDMRLYGQQAFVCEARTGLDHRQTAWQSFLATGPVAFLPLANGNCSVVWTCDAELASEVADLDAASFGRRLEEALDRKLGNVDVVSPVRSFDLSRRQAARYVADRGALIGDAAHVVHPLAGQGANLGFGDAWSLARIVRDAEGNGRDIGQVHVLRRYERWRRSENSSMIRMLDALHGLFSTDSGVLRRARGLGLRMVDRQHWLKHYLARQAIGPAVPGISRIDV